MPVENKKIELSNGKKILVRQASGLEKLGIEAIQARTFRKFRHFGPDPTEWSEEQNLEFIDALDEAGAGMDCQIREWVPSCIVDEDVDVNELTSEELREILVYVRGDTGEDAIPLE